MKGRPAPDRTMIVGGKPLPPELDEAMVHAFVYGFYDEIRRDDLLAPVFNGVIAPDAWPGHLAKMCDFWSSTLRLDAARHAQKEPVFEDGAQPPNGIAHGRLRHGEAARCARDVHRGRGTHAHRDAHL